MYSSGAYWWLSWRWRESPWQAVQGISQSELTLRHLKPEGDLVNHRTNVLVWRVVIAVLTLAGIALAGSSGHGSI
jgi:hypothetical protein